MRFGFVEELIPRVVRAGVTGPEAVTRRFGVLEQEDHGPGEHAGWTYSIGITPAEAHQDRDHSDPRARRQTLEDYPDGGEAQIAQTMLGRQRLIVRRTRLIGPQAELWPDWRYFAFLTPRVDALELVESEHRQHAVVELAIRDLKDQALAHFPSGKFLANAAWTVIAALGAQPPALDHPDRAARHRDPHRPHVAPPAADRSRPDHPNRPDSDTPDARPVAMGDRRSSPPSSASAPLPPLT